jgi:hypothetical protein
LRRATDICLSHFHAKASGMPGYAERVRISRLLQRLAARREERIEVALLLDQFGQRGFGALMLLLALPNLIFLPPGTSTLLGAPLILIAAQLALGRKSVWLPRGVRRWSLERSVFARVVERVGPYLRRAEGLLAPRLQFVLGPIGTRLIGTGSVLLGILLALPIPFANFFSGLAMTCFALALLQRDGVAAALGWVCTIVSAVVTILVSGAAWLLGKRLLEAVAGA